MVGLAMKNIRWITGEANNWTWLESIHNKAYGALSPALPFAYPMVRTLEVTVNTNNSGSGSPGLLYSRRGAESEMSDTDRNHINLHKKIGLRMSSRGRNEFRGRGIFNMTGGSYLLAAASPLQTKGLSYFLWTETETPINPRGRAHLRLLLHT